MTDPVAPADLKPPPAKTVVYADGSVLLPPELAPNFPAGIKPSEAYQKSQIIYGQWWIKLVGILVLLATSGIGALSWLTPEWVAILTNQDVVGMIILPAIGLIVAAANWFFGEYIRRGRLNDGKALSPLIQEPRARSSRTMMARTRLVSSIQVALGQAYAQGASRVERRP